MEDSLESGSLKDDGAEKEANISLSSKLTEIHPLAFTIEFDDQKFDETKKSKVRERLSALSLKHKRNPSLPDFRDVKNSKISPPVEKVMSVKSASFQHVLGFDKKGGRSPKTWETHWKSTPLKAAKNLHLKSPLSFKIPNFGMGENISKISKVERRYSLDGNDDAKNACQNVILIHPDNKISKNANGSLDDEPENKSDTISEAGTYTVDKEENENAENDASGTLKLDEGEQHERDINGLKKNYHSSWIKDWVRDVEKQNMLNLGPREPGQGRCPNPQTENGSSSISKIPSPLNSLTRKAKPRGLKSGSGPRANGLAFHKRSSSLGAKDSNGSHGSESSLETESFLRATESAMTSIQNRLRLSLERSPDLRRVEKRGFNYKERPHPPSTASDTDTNSETDAKGFKKPLGNPFTSARLNRAFSLRRAKADPEKQFPKQKNFSTEGSVGNLNQTSISKTPTSKPPSSTPFSRSDCGRFSMKTPLPSARSNATNQAQKKEVKKSSAGSRSSSSLSAREVEFQNWRRRKSFDPMKAAAEGRKKEMAKRAVVNSSLTQSVNLGSAPRTPSGEANPVLRSASFHSTAQVLAPEDEGEQFQEQESTDEQDESSSSPWLSARRSRANNPPSQHCLQCRGKSSTPVCGSRSSLASETHSSPSRRLKSNDLENLVLSAICDSSHKLKLKSCRLLRKLSYLYEADEERRFRLKEEVAILESGQVKSGKNSPVQETSSRDLFAILKNLKGVENVFNVLEEVLFDESLGIYLGD